MRVLGYDPVMSKEGFAANNITQAVKVDQIWKEADFITVHTPLTPETNNLLNDESLAKCKKGVRIINCARGGISKYTFTYTNTYLLLFNLNFNIIFHQLTNKPC